MLRSKRGVSRGVTLTEVAMAAAVLGVFAVLSVGGIRFITNMSRQRVAVEAQRDAQVTLYQVTSDIRNSDQIISLSTGAPYSLSLQTYDYSRGYDIQANPDLFSANNVVTITYTFHEEEGGYLERVVIGRTGIEQRRKFLKSLLKPDNSEFLLFRPLEVLPPYSTVEVVFRVAPSFLSEAPRIMRAEAMIRTRAS